MFPPEESEPRRQEMNKIPGAHISRMEAPLPTPGPGVARKKPRVATFFGVCFFNDYTWFVQSYY